MASEAQILPLAHTHTHTGIWPLITVGDDHRQGSGKAPMLYVALNEQLFNILFNLIVQVPPGLICCAWPRLCSGGRITHFLSDLLPTLITQALPTLRSFTIYFYNIPVR